jgi:hypothetical protein
MEILGVDLGSEMNLGSRLETVYDVSLRVLRGTSQERVSEDCEWKRPGVAKGQYIGQ